MLIGAHCRGGVKGAVDHAVEIEADAVQLFVQSPRTWRFPDHDPADLAAFRAHRKEAGLSAVLVHALYLVNLASPNEDFYANSVETLVKTVEAACSIEADGVVFHVGSHQGAGFDVGLARVLPAMELALERCAGPTWLLVENTAGAGGTIGRSVEELTTLVKRVGRHPRLGVCLDSCHLYASGYDVTDPEILGRLLADIDGEIGLDRLRCLHVNDSKAPLGSNRDRHDVLLQGLMGEQLGVFLGHPALQHLPAVVETGTSGGAPSADDMRVARELHARWATRPAGRGPARGTKAPRAAARRTRD